MLARAALATAYVRTNADRPIQLATLSTPAAAADGTLEPRLVSVPYSGAETHGNFQLLTLSDHTLTARGAIEERGYPEATALIGRSLVTVSSTQLRTFDARSLDEPLELGQLELNERYLHVFGFGDYVVRIRQHPWVLPPEQRAVLVKDDLQVLRRTRSSSWDPPLATLPVESAGDWVQLGSALVNVQVSVADYGGGTNPRARVAIQAYDLRDPTTPRKAGSLSTTEIDAEWSGGHFSEPSIVHHALGQALVIPQWKRQPDVHVRSCWRSINYDMCANSGMPGCTPDVYTGALLCRIVDAKPEPCTLHSLTHCVADRCEELETLPDGIPSVEQDCSEFVEPGRATTFAFNVIDLRDPDQPALVRPAFALPGDDFLRDSYFVRGTQIYATERDRGAALFGSVVDFSDPLAPTLSARRNLSAQIVAATEHEVYIAPQSYGEPNLTLSRVRCCNSESQLLAARAWPDRALVGLQPDAAGHLLLLHRPRDAAVPSSDVRANWTQLEVLDAQTLATLGSLDIDAYTDASMPMSDGRLLIDGTGAYFLVDVRDPRRPSLQAALPQGYGPSLFERAQLVIADEHGFRSYPADLRNLP